MAAFTDGREVLAAPYAVYIAPGGTAFPAVDDDESAFDAAWVLLGTNGTKNYVDSGVVLTLNETVTDFTGAGGTRPMNAWRTAEGGTVAFSLADMSTDMLAHILDEATVTTVAGAAGVPGSKSFSADRGVQTYKYAVLLRGLSPEGTVEDALNAQWQITRAYQSGNQALTYTKGTPTELPVEFTILEGLGGVSSCEYFAQTPAA